MSLPPGFLDELRSRTSLSSVAGRKVVWDARKSNQGKGDMWSPCPFHQEKTASFHVDDRKGFYYCFGCHAKGDAISFVRETENVGFMEAVEILAREAGMNMPESDPRAQEKADHRAELVEVMELAVRWFRLQLRTQAGQAARRYLNTRGLSEEAQAHWGIGFAPDAWQGLWDALKGKGVADEKILAAGLAKPSTKGGKPYDTFRGRIMFPIRDARGKTIAFGGRAMDPNDQAKYLNSPETALFDKGRNLYNVKEARAAAGKGQPLLVAEGYMDVIALHGAGFEAAVAPLGTAITENQLQMLWRIDAEPIITLDGDTAGQRAALRLIDLALPLLEAGKSLRFCMMPEGQDPDDLLKSGGRAALEGLLAQAVPMVQLLWQREKHGRVFDSPERKAALDKALREKIKLIQDPALRRLYGQEIKDLRWELFRKAPGDSGSRKPRARAPQGPTDTAKSSVLAVAQDARATESMREAVVLAACLTCPSVVSEFEDGLEAMSCTDPTHKSLRHVILRDAASGAEVLREKVVSVLGADTLEIFLTQRHLAVTPCFRNPADGELMRLTVAEELAKLEAARGLGAEIAEALEDVATLPDETVTWRLSEAARAAERAQRAGQEDKVEYLTEDNGALIRKEDRSAWDNLLGTIDFNKPKSRR
ncbi:MAG: DNA primase [Pseudomonadota bacterium]